MGNIWIYNTKDMTLRRIFSALLLSGMAIMGLLVQDLKIKEEGKLTFKPHWYLQLQGGAAYTLGETDFSKLMSPAAALHVGYLFNSTLGIRVGAQGWQAKGVRVVPETIYKFNYLQGNVAVTLDLANLIAEYNPRQKVEPYLVLGGGVNYAFSNNEANDIGGKSNRRPEYLWNDHLVSPVGQVGLGSNFRLNDRVSFNFEVNSSIVSDHFNSKKAGNVDWQFNGLLGITIAIGDTYSRTEPIYYDPAPAPAPMPKRAVREERPAPPVMSETSKPEERIENIFFTIGSAEIAEGELRKLEALADYMRANPTSKISVTGYADADTGSHGINLRLSEKRVSNVSGALIGLGIEEDRIL